MKFSAREDIEAPIDQVFAALCEFETYERQAMRRGADVRRTDTLSEPGVGMSWDTRFSMRGRERDMALKIVRFDRPNEINVAAKSQGLDAMFTIELLALSRSRTRLSVALDLSPQNLSARLLVQSLKLAKATLSKRFKLRVADYCKTMEARLQASA